MRRARALPSEPMSGLTASRVAGMPASPKACSQAWIRRSTVSTSVPSRSKMTASGRSGAWVADIGLRYRARSGAGETELMPIDPADLDPDPVVQLEAWLADAEAAGLPLASAFALATVGSDGEP